MRMMVSQLNISRPARDSFPAGTREVSQASRRPSVRIPCYPRMSRSRVSDVPTLPRLGSPARERSDNSTEVSKATHACTQWPIRANATGMSGSIGRVRSLPRTSESAPNGATRVCDRRDRELPVSRLTGWGMSSARLVGEAQNAGRHASQPTITQPV